MTVTASPHRRGAALLDDPLANKGTAFTAAERHALGLDGLLPPVIETLEQQALRAYEALSRYGDNLAKHVYLRALQDTNEVLFSKLIVDHVEELLPIVYTPTVGLVCQQFSHIYRRNRGLFLSYPHRNRLPELLRNRPNDEVDVIVVTDGERVLGLGDQGAGGLAISIGKLALYSAIGGIHPARTLPIVLDVGTNNRQLLDDPEYIGWRHQRIDGGDYYDFVEHFVEAVEQELPGTLLQWGDFAAAHARPILQRYRHRLLTFNDDIQGTAAVVVGVLTGAVHASGSRLRDQRVAMLGAGSAGIGVADMLRSQMVADGLPDAQARQRFYLINRAGLLTEDRSDLSAEQRLYAQPAAALAGWTQTSHGPPNLADVVANTAPTILIGLSTAAGAFDESIVRQMAAKTKRPIIFRCRTRPHAPRPTPLTLPAGLTDAHWSPPARPTHRWTLTANESPSRNCNNVFVFPAIGLGVVASRARRVTDAMLNAAARVLGALSPALDDQYASLLPPINQLRSAAVQVATTVAITALHEGVAPDADDEALRARVAAAQWTPQYT